MNIDITNFPTIEDNWHEYKSSKTPDKALKKKVQAGASAFLNSGGGYFVLGMDDDGNADGGLTTTVGSQSREDWLDALIHQVSPTPSFKIHRLEEIDSRGNLEPGNCLYVIQYDASELAPHMSGDDRYYIRAGAHTVPANSFIVEALWSRRFVRKPNLVHIVRLHPNERTAVQIGVVPTNDQVALNVRVNISPLLYTMKETSKYWPLQIPIVDRANPLFFDYMNFHRISENLDQETSIEVEYEDVLGKKYTYEDKFLIASSIGPGVLPSDLVNSLDNIAKAINKT